MQRRTVFRSPASRRAIAAPFLLCAVAAWCGCRSADAPAPPPTAAHAVDSDELEVVMRQIERLELDLEAERRRHRETVARLAGSIARSALEIPAVLDDVELPDAYRAEFRGLAEDLRTAAAGLRDDAAALSTAELAARMQAMRASCTGCHTRFRVLPAVR